MICEYEQIDCSGEDQWDQQVWGIDYQEDKDPLLELVEGNKLGGTNSGQYLV